MLPEVRPGVACRESVDIIRQEAERYDVLLMGCGLGQDGVTISLMKDTLFELRGMELPMVLDADALNALAQIPDWWQELADDAILTPHPGEMARLTGLSVDEIQQDRTGIAGRMAAKWHKTVVLKGAYTVIAEPGGNLRVSPFVNPGLASAGTGDVLAGIIAGLLGQGLSFFDAAITAVYLHGEDGEMVKEKLGDTGMIASDLPPNLPLVVKKLKEA
ncbi:MAG: NAD(P)H-hydrate dehydratase [Chloroflexota bacterium]